MPDQRTLQVSPDEEGQRLDRWLASHVPELSRSRLRALIDTGHVRVEGTAARASRRVRVGQRIDLIIPEPTSAVPLAEDIPLAVVYDDADLLVVDKPAGLVVHPGAGHSSGTLVNALLHHVRDLSGIGGVIRPGIVHRLDRGTSGLMVIAKNDAVHQALVRQFASRSVEKEYLAIVIGKPPRPTGTIDAPIGRHPVHRQRMSTRASRGRPARSEYAVVEVLNGASLLRVRIHTGRTHQIRVHLASIGHPVVGDRAYGGGRAGPSGLTARPALHATRLSFEHPSRGERMNFTSPLPPDLQALLESLRA